MFPSNAYVIRRATEDDEVELRRLAELDGQRPLTGPALVGEIDGKPAAAERVRSSLQPFMRAHGRTA